jgi:ubiquinone/menaquinone biosynthesis C-methylase UbiE
VAINRVRMVRRDPKWRQREHVYPLETRAPHRARLAARKLACVIDCPPDFSRTAADYARHRAGFPPELLDRLATRGVARPGAGVVDLGTGTGSLARLFALNGCEVTGVDIAAPLLEPARRLDQEAGVRIAYVESTAEATGLPSGAFDVVSAGQCWHWFDRPAAAREVARLLASAGSVVIAHFDWLPVKGNVVEATEEIILRYTPTWPFADRAGLYAQWLVDLQTAGFTGIETFCSEIRAHLASKAGSSVTR